MVKGKLIAFGMGFLIFYILLLWVLPNYFPQLEFLKSGLSGTFGFYLVVGFAVLIAISGFLPYSWSKILREISYLLLLITVLITEMAIVSPFVHKVEVDMSECNVVFPRQTSENMLYNVIDYTSCILSGYYPSESPETANVAWATFYIFYLILPFAFIWTIIYGLMSGMGMESWFGSFGKTANRLLSFIIAIFATRVLMGEVLLEFLGYGAWGLAGLFGAIFLTKGVQHMIEQWFAIEKMSKETREAIEKEMKLHRESMKNLGEFLNKCSTAIELNELITPGQMAFEEIFKYLPTEMQANVRSIVQDPSLTVDQKKMRILAILEGRKG